MSQANSTALKAIEILLAFDADRSVWTADDIARRFAMSRSSAYRYLGSLLETGLLQVDANGNYRLGTRIFSLARVARLGVKILDLARPHLESLQALTSETVLLSHRQGSLVVVLECLESTHSTRITFDRGHIEPNPASATAKALLAHAPEDDVRKLLHAGSLVRYTDRTMTDPSEIMERLREVRRRGFAVNDGEVDDEVRAVAAPVVDANGFALYALSVVAPRFRLTDDRMEATAKAVCDTAARISSSLLDYA